MDLSRWYLRSFSSNFSERYRGFQEFLGDVLEGESSVVGGDSKAEVTPFSVRADYATLNEEIADLFLTSTSDVTGEMVFEAMAPFFEAGFCFALSDESKTKSPAVPRLKSMFLFGRVFHPPEKTGAPLSSSTGVDLPRPEEGQVLRGRVQPLLRAFRLEGLRSPSGVSLEDAGVFAFSPRKDMLFLLVCNRPHPWQVGAIESVYLQVIEAMGANSRQDSNSRSKVGLVGLFKRGFFK